MKILIVQGGIQRGPVSGEDIVVDNDINFLKKDHLVRYANIKIPGSGFTGLIARLEGITWSFRHYYHVKRLIRSFSPDIIHFHSTTPYLSNSVLVAAFRSGVPIVQTLHNARLLCVEGGFYREKHYCDDCVGTFGFKGVLRGCSKGRLVSFINFLTNLLMRKTGYIHNHISRFLAVSDFVREKHLKSFFPPEKIVTRNNGFSIQVSPYDNSLSKKGITFAGRISIAKGSQIIQLLIANFPHEINIIGDGPNENELKYFCKINNFSHVKFHGRLSNQQTIEIIRSSVLSVIPSLCGDSFPTTALESVGVGTPVVATAVGGLPDLIIKSEAGIVVPYDKPEEFIAGVNKLYSDPASLEKMADNGKKYVTQNLALDQQGQKLVEIYRDVLSESA